MLDMLCSGDTVAAHTDKLFDATLAHHKLYIRLYVPRMAKPKMHLIFHAIWSIARLRRSLNCFSLEAHHKSLKAAGSHARGNCFESSCLQRVLGATVALIDRCAFESSALRGACSSMPSLRCA
eukprot:9502922-Pyramimonas_sp.AAC.1